MKRHSVFPVVLGAGCLAMTAADAFELALPVGAELTAERASAFDVFQAPLGPFDGSVVPKRDIEGAVSRKTWRIAERDLTPLQIVVPIREQMEEQGYQLVFECASADCGGFDFRFDVEVLPGPNMFVDISQFRYLTAFRGEFDAPDAVVSVLASVTAGAAYVQVIEAQSQALTPDNLAPAPSVSPDVNSTEAEVTGATTVAAPSAIAERLLTYGHTVLDGLDFAPGTSTIGNGPWVALDALAQVLRDRPDLRVSLVGHTDTVGGLNDNIALSRARAVSVRAVLVEEYGIPIERMDAEGVGFLAPIASNLTPEGRELNRRVEAVLIFE